MLSLIIKEFEANEISTLKSLWCILKFCQYLYLKSAIDYREFPIATDLIDALMFRTFNNKSNRVFGIVL